MGQINPFSAYGTDPVQLDRHLIGDREGGQPRRQPKREKPAPKPEDQVELHADPEESPPPAPEPPSEETDGPEHLDITA